MLIHSRLLVAIVALALAASSRPSLAFNNSNLTYSAVTTNLGAVLEWPGDSGTNNTLSIINGAVVTDTGHWFGGINGVANHNFAIVSGSGSVWSNNSGNSFVGRYGGGNQVIVTNGGTWVSSTALIGSLVASASNNAVLVTGSGSLFKAGDIVLGGGGNGNSLTVAEQGTLSYGTFTIGENTVGNQLLITNGGKAYGTINVFVGSLNLYGSPAGSNNMLIVSGPGSVLTNSSDLFVGRFSASNSMTIANGGMVVNRIGYIGSNNNQANSNAVLVTGVGSIWTNTGGMLVGGAGNGNRLTVTDSGLVYVDSSVSLGTASGGAGNTLVVSNGGRFHASSSILMGDTVSDTSDNTVIVTGSGSFMGLGGGILVGRYSTGNKLIIADGGVVTNTTVSYLGATAASSSNNSALVTGPGSTWSNASTLVVGNASSSNRLTVSDRGTVFAGSVTVGSASVGNNVVSIDTGGTLDAGTGISVGSATGNVATNVGGVYQFSTAAPGITAGRVFLTDGTVSFRGINNASVLPLASLTYSGVNDFRLNASSNAVPTSQSYTFDTGMGATNYAGLELVNGTTLWRSQRLTIGANGSFLASNTIGTVAAVITNLGSITVVNSHMTWSSNVVISGSYVSDPSTNTFLADLTITPSGTLAGGVGDLFDFKKSLLINSTNNIQFDLSLSTVSFSGGGDHTNAVTGGDFGTNKFPSANFSYGTLKLGASDDLFFISGGSTNGGATANALYIDHLILGNNDTNLVANLHSAFNIYYMISTNQPGNAYLNDLTYALDGGGFLMPVIPEPTTTVLFALGACAILSRRRS